ncbi:MAG TPA: hypothetical protein VKR60_01515 [Candidatus Sulfotelmatobacter sp.]|nr:hypothetical protein [Candidatus Sulfotelmatobacter sp.]
MTRFAVAAIALMILFVFILSGSPAVAQSSSQKMQVFGGYSLLHADNGGLTASALNSALRQPAGTLGITSNYSGWNAEVQYSVNHWLGAVVDFAGHSGTAFPTSNLQLSQLPNANQYSILFGPQISSTRGKFTPFVHVLGGVDRQHIDAGSIPGVFGSSQFVTDWAPAVAVGGGLDYKVYPRFSVRLGQFDYYYAGHNLKEFYGSSFGPNLFPNLATKENNLRFSAGIVVRF